eukprot:4448956-Amphidinium_carterae.1
MATWFVLPSGLGAFSAGYSSQVFQDVRCDFVVNASVYASGANLLNLTHNLAMEWSPRTSQF